MKEQFFSCILVYFFSVYVCGERHSSENPSTIFVSREGKRYIFLCNSFLLCFFLVWRWQRVPKMVDKNRKFVFFFSHVRLFTWELEICCEDFLLGRSLYARVYIAYSR